MIEQTMSSSGPVDAGSGPPLRILHVFPTFAIGGSQVRFTKLAAGLGDRFEHAILALSGCYDCMDLLEPGVSARKVSWTAPKGLPATLMGFRKLFSELRPDLVMTYNWGAMECALAAALPPRYRHIHLEDGFGPDEVHGQLRRRVLFRRLALRRCQNVIVPSHVLHRIAAETWHVPEHRLALIPNGIDCDAFAAPPDPARVPGLTRGPHTSVVGTVATLRPEKNIGRLIRAFATARRRALGLELLIVGDGPSRGELVELVHALDLDSVVHFAGRIDKPEAVVGLMDIFALSSDTEQMPISVIEAMAAGLPVASPAVGDVAMMVSERNRSLITPPGDEAGLARTIETLARDPDLRREIGEQNRQHVGAHYREDQMVQAHGALMRGPR